MTKAYVTKWILDPDGDRKYGEEVGDIVYCEGLLSTTKHGVDTFRPEGYCYEYSGDEFHLNIRDAINRAEQMRDDRIEYFKCQIEKLKGVTFDGSVKNETENKSESRAEVEVHLGCLPVTPKG